jgi:hypothetical protein
LIYLVADNKTAIEAKFIFGSTVKAAITVEVVSTGKNTATGGSGAITYTADNATSVKTIADAINLKLTSSLIGLDVNATGTVAAGIALTSVIGLNYASAIRNNIAEASVNTGKFGVMNRAQHEKGPKYKLGLISMDKQVEIEGIEIEADTTNIQIKDFAAMGVNVISHLYTGVQNQLVQTIDEIILDRLYKLGVEHALGVWESQGINYSLYIGSPGGGTAKTVASVNVKFEDILGNDVRARFDTGTPSGIVNSLVSAAYENQMTHGERLYARILLISEFGSYQNRIAPYDYMVVSGEIAATLKKQATFTPNPVATTLSSSPELSYTGTVYDTISVYKNPRIAFNDPRILMGRRGNDTDPGPKLLAYDLAASRQTLAEDTMAEKIRVWSRFTIVEIGFYPELNAYTWLALNEYNWS